MPPEGLPVDTDDEGSDDDDDFNLAPDKNANQVRRQITTFLDSGAMKVGEFQKAIDVGSVGYYRFMKQNGPTKGMGSDVYYNAWKFFKKRELRGVKMPRKKQKTVTDASGKKKEVPAHEDISGIHLEGEDEDDVPVYDSCDEIRRKINAYLKQDGVTQAAFLRELLAQFHADKKPKGIQSSQLQKFRSQSGPNAGNTSSVFYSAYIFFEKLRLAQGKPKSSHRLDMEEAWPDGFEVDELTDPIGRRVIVPIGRTPYVKQDSVGRVQMHYSGW